MSARARFAAAVLALCTLVVVGACGGGGGSESSDTSRSSSGSSEEDAPFSVPGEPVATETVSLPQSYKFEPAVIKIAPGATVTWENKDNFPHNVKVLGDREELKDLPIGATAEITFADAGTYFYECTLHPNQMKGKIFVEA